MARAVLNSAGDTDVSRTAQALSAKVGTRVAPIPVSAVAVQYWAQQNDATLRAVIGLEHQFANANSGVHQEVLVHEGIPAKGKMLAVTVRR